MSENINIGIDQSNDKAKALSFGNTDELMQKEATNAFTRSGLYGISPIIAFRQREIFNKLEHQEQNGLVNKISDLALENSNGNINIALLNTKPLTQACFTDNKQQVVPDASTKISSASDIADKWSKSKAKTEKWLDEVVDGNPSMPSVLAAATLKTSMDLGEGIVDILNLGEGAAEGGIKGFGKDTLRALGIAWPYGRGVRSVYVKNIDKIGDSISGMKPAQAYKVAVEARNAAKVKARKWMDPISRKLVEIRNMKKYKNPVGPTPEQALKSAQKNNGSFAEVIEKSTKTSKNWNAAFGISGK